MGSLITIVGLALVVVFIIYVNRRASLYHAFDDIGKKYLGRVYTTWAGSPGVVFRFRDSPARLTATCRLPRNGGRQTQFLADWPDRRFELVLWRRGARFRSLLHPNLSRLSNGGLAEINEFEVWTNNEAVARLVLSPACIWQIVRLSEQSKRRLLVWRIRRGKFQLSAGGHIRDKRRLSEVLAAMLEIYSQSLLSQQQGLDFLDEQTAHVIENMTCPVCSCAMETEVVLCARCRTPHCKDCWLYNGKCATYGCGAEKFVALAQSNPVGPMR